MGSGDGTVGGVTKILDNGSNASLMNIVLVAEGFTAAEQATFDTRCGEFVTTLQAEPWYPVLGSAINVHRLNVSSTDSGADDPASCGDGSTGSGTAVATFFDASFCTAGIRRCLGVNWGLVRTTLTAALPQWFAAAVIVNTTQRGGCASGNVFATALSTDWLDVAIHEMGHAAFGLADEYSTWAGCSSGETDRDNAPAGEPFEPNITTVTSRATLKWRHLVRPEIPVPSMQNPDCTACDERANAIGDDAAIGLFEGAGYYHCGRYRPAYTCRMRDSSKPFCRVCVAAIHDRLSDFVTPAPQLEVVTGDGSTLLDFGEVAHGMTMYRSFEVRNVRVGWPGELRVTLTTPAAPFGYPSAVETSFTLAAPVTEALTSRPVFVAFTAPETGGPQFLEGLDVASVDDPAHSPIHLSLDGHAVLPPPVDSVLVVDRSGSMSEPSGIPNTTKGDVALTAGSLYVSLLRDGDQIGLVRYNDASADPADILVPMTAAGPSPGGAGRAAMQGALIPSNFVPAGATSIGAGIIRGSAVLDGAVADARAMVVLTDGIQNTAPDIPAARANVQTKSPPQRVFAVGLGLNQLEDKLAEIASVTNGVAHITGDLVGWKEFLLQKLYVQILSDVADEAFVKDPRDVLLPGEERATDVTIGEVDIAADFVLVLRPTPIHPKYTQVWLEAPDGTILQPADAAALPNAEYVAGPAHAYFRWQFPAFPARPGAHLGRWRVWVRNRYAYRPQVLTHVDPAANQPRESIPLYYSVMAKARSDLRLGGRLVQASYLPGSPMTVVLEPTLYGLPVGLDGAPEARITRPDGALRSLPLAADGGGGYSGVFTDTGLIGPYLVSAEVQATSPAGYRLTRFRHLTGIIFRPVRDPGDGGGPGGGGPDARECCERILRALARIERQLGSRR